MIPKKYIDDLDDSISVVFVTKHSMDKNGIGSKTIEMDNFERVSGSGSKTVWEDTNTGTLINNNQLAKRLSYYDDYSKYPSNMFDILLFDEKQEMLFSFGDFYPTLHARRTAPVRRIARKSLPNFTAGFRKML